MRSCDLCHGPLRMAGQAQCCTACGARHEGEALAPYPWEVPRGLETRMEPVRVACAQCHEPFDALAATFVNVAQCPGFETLLAMDALNQASCPACGQVASVVPPAMLWWDPAARIAVEVAEVRENEARWADAPRAPPGLQRQRISTPPGGGLAALQGHLRHRPRAVQGLAGRAWSPSQLRHALADAGMAISWLEVHVLQLALERPSWPLAAFRRRMGTPVEGPLRDAVNRLAEQGLLEVDASPPGALRAGARLAELRPPQETPRHRVLGAGGEA